MSDILTIIVNIFQGLFTILMYMMPFWVFDTMATFIDLYGSAFYIFMTFIISFIFWLLFLIYFLELFNLPIDTSKDNLDGLSWWEDPSSNSITTKDKTFLTETMRFLFWAWNFWTYKEVIIIYFSNIRFKIIPILFIVVLLYVPFLGGWKWYSTVWQFYFANKDYIVSWIPLVSNNLDEEARKQLNESIKYNKPWEMSVWAFTDKKYVEQQLTNEAKNNEKLNTVVKHQAAIYKNVYDEASYNKYVWSIDTKMATIDKQLEDLEKQKSWASKSLAESIVKKEKALKEQKAQYEIDKTNTEVVYNSLNSWFKDYTKNSVDASLEKDTIWLEAEYKLKEDMLNLASNKITKESLNKQYDTTLAEINKVIKWEATQTSGSNEILKSVNSYLKSWWTADSLEAVYSSKISENKLNLLNANSITPSILNTELKTLWDKISSNKQQLNISKNLTSKDTARLDYFINQNAEKLANADLTQEERDHLLLLQSKLISEKEAIQATAWESHLLFGNRIQYTWLNVLTTLQFFLDLIWIIFQILFIFAIILMSWWKNLYLLYTSLLNGTISLTEKYIWQNKNIYTWLVAHRDRFTTFMWLNNATDREFIWFQENKTKMETYIIITIEFFVRVWFVYWMLLI